MNEILDFVVISLLIIAIIYGYILNRKIVLIQNSKKELANLFKSFDDTILKAQIGIDDLKSVSNEVSKVLQQKLDKAAFTIDDLTFLNEKAVQICTNMEKIVSSAKRQPNIAGENAYNPEVIKSMKQSSVKQKERANTILTPASETKRTRLLEGMLEKISERRNAKEQANSKISNDNKNVYSPAPLNNSKTEQKVVADVLKSLGYGDV
ncbi:MAG: hypothetical protein K0R98_828 [Rickettsiaceae bacterium]|jgi:hypothetical protein|nr:hypothetical protein [Rickettsiaceae bacterium]